MLVLALALLLAAAPKPPLLIYVFTQVDASGLVDADQQRRQDSVKDLRGVLDKRLKHFDAVLVDDRAKADVVIEVLSSAAEDHGNRTGSNPLTGMMGANKVQRERVVRGRVSLGEYSTEIANGPRATSWKSAAMLWQQEFRKWVNSNSEQLAAKLQARAPTDAPATR